jgi:hypothetical protein
MLSESHFACGLAVVVRSDGYDSSSCRLFSLSATLYSTLACALVVLCFTCIGCSVVGGVERGRGALSYQTRVHVFPQFAGVVSTL